MAQADLSITIGQSNQAPSQYSLYSVTATVMNNGPQTATGVRVQIPTPSGVVYEGGNEFSASQGSLRTYGSNAGRWTVGSIPSGSSATITVNYFLNATSASPSYAEVSASNQSDPDSTPGNGNGQVNEDDEASTSGGGPTGQADLQARNLRVQNPSIAAGTNLEYRFNIRNAGTADLPGDFTVKSYISTDNILSPDDIQDGTITTGNFDAGAAVQNILGASSTNGLAPGNYFVIVFVDADDVVNESNESNNTRVSSFTITGGSSGGDIDLSLTLSQNVTTPGRYTLYSVTATVSNAGPQTATGVSVDLPVPTGVVYEGGNEYSASQGRLSTYGSNQGRWNVGSIAAQSSATITVNYFRTGATASDSYAEVLTADQQDGDSTPGNGNGQVNEDDEASTGGPTGPTCAFTTTLLSVDCSDNGTPTDPTDDTYSIVVSAENPGSAAGSWQSSNYPVGASYGQSIREDIGLISFYPSGQIIMADVANSSCRDTLSFTAPAPCSNGNTSGACTFENPATIDPADQQFYTDINVEQTSNGYELTALSDFTFNNTNRRIAVYNFDADGVQVSPTPSVTSFTFTENVTLDFQTTEFIINDFNGGTTTVPFTDPAPAGSPGFYEGGFTARLPDGSGYLVFVRQIELNGANPDVTTLRSFKINNNYQQVGGVTTYPAMPTRYEAATFLAPSGQGDNFFLRIIERGTNNTFVLVDGNYDRLGAVSLGVNGRFFQPFEFQELNDGTFVLVSFFDGADPNRALQISRYNRNGTSIQTYFSSSSVIVRRYAFQAAVRQDGGFVGVSQRNVSGSTIEVRNGNGALLAENYLDGLFNIDIVGVTQDTSIIILANRDSLGGQRVIVKLTRLAEQECNLVFDPCDPPQTEPSSAIVSHSVASGGIVTVQHNLYGAPGTITIDGPARLGVQLIDPAEFRVSSVTNHRGRVYVIGTLRDNVNPGNARPYVLETDISGNDLSSFLPALRGTDLISFNVIGSVDFATIVVEYFTWGRSYGIAKIRSGQIRADEILVGDLVTNRVRGAVINEDDGVIYLSYRNGNSASWPRMLVLDFDDLSTIADVRLADAVISSNGLISGDNGFPNVLSTGDVAVPFTAFDNNMSQQFAAIVDPLGNIVSTTTLPNTTPSTPYVASGVTPTGDVRFIGSGSIVAWLANGTVTNCSSGPAQGVDLEVSASSASSQPQVYDTNSITVSVTNAGTQTATGVTVDIPRPAGVVYTGGNEYTASQGNMATYGTDQGEWTVGDLAAGATATIVVNYFSLSTSGYSQFVEVLSQNEMDADSAPGNGNGASAVEDDEAYLDLTTNAPLALTINFYPNPAPAGEQIVLKYESSGETEVPMLISDLNGRVIHRSSVQFNDGYNQVPVSIGDLPSGVYVLTLSDTGLQPTRLVVR